MTKNKSMNFLLQSDQVNRDGNIFPKDVLEKALEDFGARVEKGERNLIHLNSGDKVVGKVIEVQPDMITVELFDGDIEPKPLLTSISSKLKGE